MKFLLNKQSTFNLKSKKYLVLYSILIFLSAILLYLPTLFLNKTEVSENSFLLILMFFIGYLAAKTLISFFSMFVGEFTKNKIEKELRETLFNKFLAQNIEDIRGKDFNHISIEVTKISSYFSSSLVNVVQSVVFCLSAFSYAYIYMGLQNIWLFVFSFSVTIIWIAFSFIMKPIFMKNQKNLLENESRFQSTISKYIKNIEVASKLGKESFIFENVNKENKKFYNLSRKVSYWKAINHMSTSILFSVSQI